MRVFVALDIDTAIRKRIARFIDGISGFAPEIRFVRPESLHVTLKFIGEKPEESVETITQVLSSISGATMEITFRGHGFFPSPKSPRIFWIGITANPELKTLARNISQALSALNIPGEEHEFNPHLTLARGGRNSAGTILQRGQRKGDRPGNTPPVHPFQHLQEKLSALPAPEFGTMTARDFFLYKSQPSPRGSIYTQMARFALG